MTRRPLACLVAFGLLLTLGVVGCAPAPAGRVTSMPTPSSATLPSDAAPTAAADLFAVSGFTLPASASDISVRLIDYPPYEDVSVTTFRAPRADAIAMFEAIGYPVVPVDSISLVDAQIMGGFTPPKDSWSVMPSTASRNSYVNFSPGDPTLVTALFYHVPSR